ncbi:AAA family ATPase [Cellulomonas sp. URHB0016]
MTTRIILASADESTLERFSQVLAEADAISLAHVVRDAPDIQDALLRYPDADVLVVDAQLDSGRGSAVARETAAANPLLGIVMLVDQAGPEQFAEAMEAGARSVIGRGSSLAEVVSRIEAVAQWVGAARAAVSADLVGGRGGRVIAVAGAKGGVGSSTLALLLARSLTGQGTVGLVDFDLQSGDLAAYLGVHTRRSVVDLVDIAGEMSGRVLLETSYDVPGGIRLMSAPNDGEREEEMTARAARAVVNALRFQHGVSVIDVGSHLTESTAAVIEEADIVVLVVTPDLPALRGARRTLAMWERLAVRSRSGVRLVINRQHRRNEVTEQFAAKVVETAVTASVPDGGQVFEAAMNTATIVGVTGPAHTAVARLAPQLLAEAAHEKASIDEAVDQAIAEASPRRRRARAQRDSGQAAVDLPVAFGLALVIFLACAQGLVWGAGHLLARNAATEGARTVGLLAYGPSTVARARDDALDQLSGPWRSGATVDVQPDTVRVNVSTPTLLPGMDLHSSVTAPVQVDR